MKEGHTVWMEFWRCLDQLIELGELLSVMLVCYSLREGSFSLQDIGSWISVKCIPQIFRALYHAETTFTPFTTWYPTWLAASFLQHIRNIGSLVYSVGSYPVMRGCGNLMMDSHSQGHERKVLFTLLVEWWNHDSLSLHTQNLHSAHKFDCLWFSPPKSKDVKHRES